MTVIAATFDKNKNILVGADRQSTSGSSYKELSSPKIIKKNNFIIGITGGHLLNNVIKYNFNIPEHNKKISDDIYINTVFIKELRESLIKNNVSKVENNKENIESSLLIAYNNKIYIISSDFCVIEYNDGYCSIGSGSYHAMGALYIYKKLKKYVDKQGIIYAIKAAIKNDIYCSGKIDVFCLHKKE